MKHRVLLVSDMHYSSDLSEKEMKKIHPESTASLACGNAFGHTQGEKIQCIYRDILAENENGKIDSVLVLGDLSIDDYSFRKLPENYCLRFKWEVMDRLPMPSYAIAGNHDSYTDDLWREMFGYGKQFSVRVGDLVFILLDNFAKVPAKDASGAGYTLTDLAFVKSEMAKYPGCRFILGAHYFSQKLEAEQNPEFVEFLRNEPSILCTMQGHAHWDRVYNFGGKPLADIGGYAYSGQVVNGQYTFGVFDPGYAWGYEMVEWDDEGGPIHCYHRSLARRYIADNGVFDEPEVIRGEFEL